MNEETLNKIIADYRRLDDACDAAIQAGAMDPDGPLFDAIWRAHDTLADLLDPSERLAWFIYDNKCGDCELKAAPPGGKLRKIKTVKHLVRLMREDTEGRDDQP